MHRNLWDPYRIGVSGSENGIILIDVIVGLKRLTLTKKLTDSSVKPDIRSNSIKMNLPANCTQ